MANASTIMEHRRIPAQTRVSWSSQAGGSEKRKTGVVCGFVPAWSSAWELIPASARSKIPNTSACDRYIVRVEAPSRAGREIYYGPLASVVERNNPTPAQQTPTIEDAISLAATAHRGQLDKGDVPAPYILHPLRVMLALPAGAAQIVGVLHDVVEDTDITLDDLRARGYSDEILQALDALTRRAGEVYRDFIVRVAQNPLACQVKLADLQDNLERMPDIPKWESLRQRYLQARAFLNDVPQPV